MTHLDGAQVNGAVHFLFTHTELVDGGTALGPPFNNTAAGLGFGDDGGNPGGLTPLPNIYAAAPVALDGDLWAGIGITAPFGLGPEYDDNFFGSFAVTEAELTTIDATPSLAYKVNDVLSLGVSGIIQYGDLNYQLRLQPSEITRVTADDYSLRL